MIMPADILVCPESKVRLRRYNLSEATQRFFPDAPLRAATATGYQPVGPTEQVMVRLDGRGAYPIKEDMPVLLAPEMLFPDDRPRHFDVTVEMYAEAYQEMEHYSLSAGREAKNAGTSKHAQRLDALMGLSAEQRDLYPFPPGRWLDATYDCASQWDAFKHLAPSVRGGRVLQLGGRGAQAVKFLLAGAAEAWFATPMLGEVLYGRALARHCGVAHRFHGIVALAEQLPFLSGSFDAVYTQGCVHHWKVDHALPECARVLKSGGRFAAVEPWRAPLYGLGTKILGKRDRAVHCVVLTEPRVAPLRSFHHSEIIHHGALTRYPLLALERAGLKPGRRSMWNLYRLDDAVTSAWPRLRDSGSSVALLATAGATAS